MEKDIITIGIAVVALIISIGTFGYDRYQAHKRKMAEQAKLIYTAYKLGCDLMYAWMPYSAEKGSKNEVERVKNEALSLIRMSQGLADQIDLRLNLQTLVESFNPSQEDTLLYTPFENIRLRLQTVHNKKIAAAFEIGQWLMFLHFVAGGTSMRNNEDLNETISIYNQVRDFIMDGFKELRIHETFQHGLKTAEDIMEESGRLRERMDSNLSY